jgi:hypothetical protein
MDTDKEREERYRLDRIKHTFTYETKGVKATAIFNSYTGRMTILKGSRVAKRSVGVGSHQVKRKELTLAKVIVDFEFTRDEEFERPTLAACVVHGGSRSGNQKTWVNQEGDSLLDLGFVEQHTRKRH